MDHTFAGESQEECMMQQSSSFLDYKTNVIEVVGLGEGLLGINGARKRAVAWRLSSSRSLLVC